MEQVKDKLACNFIAVCTREISTCLLPLLATLQVVNGKWLNLYQAPLKGEKKVKNSPAQLKNLPFSLMSQPNSFNQTQQFLCSYVERRANKGKCILLHAGKGTYSFMELLRAE